MLENDVLALGQSSEALQGRQGDGRPGPVTVKGLGDGMSFQMMKASLDPCEGGRLGGQGRNVGSSPHQLGNQSLSGNGVQGSDPGHSSDPAGAHHGGGGS